MSDEVPVWRQAVLDKAHPLHQAAWLLFSDGWSARLADRLPAEDRAKIIEFCYLLIDTEELYLERALGRGLAPANAIRLLGYWQVTDAIPRILDGMNEEADEGIFVASVQSLGTMGAAVVEPLLAYAATLRKDDLTTQVDVAEILSKTGRGDPRAFNYIRHVFETFAPTDPVLKFLAQCMVTCHRELAIPYLESCLKHSRYKRWRDDFQDILDQKI